MKVISDLGRVEIERTVVLLTTKVNNGKNCVAIRYYATEVRHCQALDSVPVRSEVGGWRR